MVAEGSSGTAHAREAIKVGVTAKQQPRCQGPVAGARFLAAAKVFTFTQLLRVRERRSQGWLLGTGFEPICIAQK